MALRQWAVPQLQKLLPLDEGELGQIVSYTDGLPDSEAAHHLENLLGDSPESLQFIASFVERRAELHSGRTTQKTDGFDEAFVASTHSLPSKGDPGTSLTASSGKDLKQHSDQAVSHPPAYGTLARPWPASSSEGTSVRYVHTNAVIEAGNRRAVDEQQMQQMLQDLQYQYNIYNTDIEPEHEAEYYCGCPIHDYQRMKWNRLGVQEMWSRAVMYPGEKAYNDNPNSSILFSGNPYRLGVVSPYGYQRQGYWGPPRPLPHYHMQWISQTISLNNQLNREAQARVNAYEPKHNIWDENALSASMEQMSLGDTKHASDSKTSTGGGYGEESEKRRHSLQPSGGDQKGKRVSKFSSFKKAIGVKSSEEKAIDKANTLRQAILAEEQGRWPDELWRQIVAAYQDKIGMTRMIADLRARCPIQYLHLLRAGYFEPIPVAWANQASNPLKFVVEAAGGWRGITPAWRGYEDLAEERLYWVLNHREGSVGMRMKPDFISEMNMARSRMSRAVEPPPLYYSADDTCHLQHTSDGYSKQVMPAPFRPYDRPELPTDDTMILLDVSGSMDFVPVRPVYNQYLITGFANSTQPKNKDVARAIVRRFTDAMESHHHRRDSYDLVTFSSSAKHIGKINHGNFDQMWRRVYFGGGTRVMTGWQKVKELHFQKHSESAIHHPVYGWQAGPETPILRLLLLLDGEATDMDEFELDLLGLSWAHVTIFLIGVDGCPHHHRHANELQRISDVNHHVSFVDAQGNCPERFVTHELLKRHLGYDISMQEFEQMEELPPYTEVS